MNRGRYRETGRTKALLFGCCLVIMAMVVAGVGYNHRFVVGAAHSQDPVEAARVELEKAIANEKANRTKEAGLAVDAALAKYNAAVEAASGGGKGTPGKVQTPAGPTPTITPETEPNNTSGTAQVLSSTENCFIVQGAVTPSGDLDYYRLDNVPAGARAWFYTDTGGTLVAGTRDSFIDVLAADGTTSIESDDDDGSGNGGDSTNETGFASSIAGRTLTTGGTYFFRVRGFGTFPGSDVVNPYRMFLVITNIAATAEVEPNGTFGTANTLVTAAQPTGIRSGTISSSGEVDFYSVETTAGNILFISMDGDPGRTGTNTLDGVVTLFAPDGTTSLFQADSGFGGANTSEAFDFNISTTGTYFVRVAGFSTESGCNYNIMVSACRGASGGSCVLTCPANITRSNDPNQCGAVVTYPAPTPSGTCGTITCSPASGSFFPKGTTTVTCTASGGSIGAPSGGGGGASCTFTVRVNDTQFPTITCPANVTRSNDPNQCGAVVTYPPPTVSDNCPGFSNGPACSPASGSFFPKGTTTVSCGVSDSSVLESICTFTVRVNDTQPPTIICPATINTAAAVSCPIAVSKVVTFSNPPASDNCPGVTVACNPPSGATFPVGCTTVTCTATDTSGNTATCTFQICVFSFCLQDETNPGNVVLANTQTGDYIFCCNGVFVASGRGVVTLRGCQGTIEDNKGDRKVEVRFDTSAFGNRGKGSSTIKIGQVIRCQITDQDMSNNTCACSTQPPSGQLRK